MALKRLAGGRAELSIFDAFGHSLATMGYVERLARTAGARVMRHHATGGARASFFTDTGASGGGGWSEVLGEQFIHRNMPRMGWPGEYGGYLPVRNAAIIHYGLNDLSTLGVNKPAPWIEAMRSIISEMLACNVIKPDHSSVTRTGTWAVAAYGAFGSGPGSIYANSSTVNSKATFAIPASFPGGTVGIRTMVGTTDNVVYTYKVDGGTGVDVTLNNALIDTTFNTQVRRIALTPGAHSIEINVKTVTAGNFFLDGLVIETPEDLAPIVLVGGMNRPYTYGVWTGSPNFASMTDANVMIWDGLLRDLVDEFPSSVVYVDVDTALNKNPVYHTADGAHLNSRGDGALEQVFQTALDANMSPTRSAAVKPSGANPLTRVFGRAGSPGTFSNGWVNAGSVVPGGAEWLRMGHDPDGRIRLTGSVVTGTATTVATLTTGWRPVRVIKGVGYNVGTGAIQRWEVRPDGTIVIASGFTSGAHSEISGELTWYNNE